MQKTFTQIYWILLNFTQLYSIYSIFFSFLAHRGLSKRYFHVLFTSRQLVRLSWSQTCFKISYAKCKNPGLQPKIPRKSTLTEIFLFLVWLYFPMKLLFCLEILLLLLRYGAILIFDSRLIEIVFWIFFFRSKITGDFLIRLKIICLKVL